MSVRFARLVDYRRQQEDRLRAELVRIDTRRQEIIAEQRLLEDQRQAAASDVGHIHFLREQFLNYCQLCDQQQAVQQQELDRLGNDQQQIKARLLTVWQQRRSLQALQERDRKAEEERQTRREQAELIDSMAQAWYLQEGEQTPTSALATVVESDSEVDS